MKEVEVRQYGGNDKNFIFATWLKNYKSSPFAKRIKSDVYFKHHHDIIEFILGKKTTEVLIAHPKDDPDFILGYLVLEKLGAENVIHFAFVKSDFQKMGICTQLIKSSEIDLDKSVFTHWTLPMNELLIKYPNLVHNPYRL